MSDSQHIDYRLLQQQAADHPFPLLFCTISGAHLYGFPSADSDFDLRGIHILPLNQVLGLDCQDQTLEKMGNPAGLELDLVTHDIKKFMQLMLKNNGYVMEQLLSPLVVTTSPEHQELKSLAGSCLTRHHVHHYRGFARNQWSLFAKSGFEKIKPLLYVFRVLLTGIHLMKTGRIEANLVHLNDQARIPLIDRLLRMKLEGPERGSDPDLNRDECENLYQHLQQELLTAHQVTRLPEVPTAKPALNDLLIRIRRKTIEPLAGFQD